MAGVVESTRFGEQGTGFLQSTEKSSVTGSYEETPREQQGSL